MYLRAWNSLKILCIAYWLVPWTGSSSFTSRSPKWLCWPLTAIELAYTTRFTPASRAASKQLSIPRMSRRMTWCGLPSPAPSPYARLMRRSGFTSRTTRITSSNWVTSPRTTGAPMGTPLNDAAPGFKSMPTTDSPRSRSRLMSRGPMKPVAPITSTAIPGLLVLLGRLPGDHAPVVAGLRVHGQVADGEAVLLAVALDVHVRHAVDDADAAGDAHVAVPRGDPAIVRLAGAQVRDVLGLRLEPGGGVHVREVVGQRPIERGPVALAHRLEAAVVGSQHFGRDASRLGRHWWGHDSLLFIAAPRPAGPQPRDGLRR